MVLWAKQAGFALGDIHAMLATIDVARRSEVLRHRRGELLRR
ncbi:hypothetical protein [Nocardia australiensis]|nr:hypothetical protein [Nocardia australiensis]